MIKKLLLSLSIFTFIVVAVTADVRADTITFSDDITGNRQVGSVGYSMFTIDADSLTRLETFTNSFDSELFLFFDDGSLDSGDWIANDDDSGTANGFGSGRNSLLELDLVAGSYIAAVGDFDLSLREAVRGINKQRRGPIGEGPYTLEVEAYSANVTVTATSPNPVPEPATVALLGIGIVGLAGAGVRRRRKKAVDKR